MPAEITKSQVGWLGAYTDHGEGVDSGVIEYQPRVVDVAALRKRLGLSPAQFAAWFGFSVTALRHWERGDRSPHGSALALLNVIDQNPEAVLQALQAA